MAIYKLTPDGENITYHVELITLSNGHKAVTVTFSQAFDAWGICTACQ